MQKIFAYMVVIALSIISSITTVKASTKFPVFQSMHGISARIDFTGTIDRVGEGRYDDVQIGDTVIGGYVFAADDTDFDFGWYKLSSQDYILTDGPVYSHFQDGDGSSGPNGMDSLSLTTIDYSVGMSIYDPSGTMLNSATSFFRDPYWGVVPTSLQLLPPDPANRRITNHFDGGFEWEGRLDSIKVSALPVPAALPLLLSGLALFGLMVRRKKPLPV